ncbi:hypothetical protein CP532_1932, partial [Ophiocordyceps camponoti-leonardi (nom. inval.)]
ATKKKDDEMSSPRDEAETNDPSPIDDDDLLLEEKKRYPGAETWAPDEERLFTILYFRQERRLLPLQWHVDFRDIPITPAIFAEGTATDGPIVYAHSQKDFQATSALIRLIDLTSTIRAALQRGKQNTAPAHIKRALDRYVSWAAEDGGYLHLDYVPNLMVEVVDEEGVAEDEDQITEEIERRMRGLARLQRRFFRIDREVDFWDVDELRASYPDSSTSALLVEKYMSTPDGEDSSTAKRSRKSRRKKVETLNAAYKEGGGRGDSISVSRRDQEDGAKIKSEPTDDDDGQDTPSPSENDDDDDDDDENSDDDDYHDNESDTNNDNEGYDEARSQASHLFNPPPHRSPTSYIRRPPVVYGLFIIRTSVLLLTVDSSKDESAAEVSFHVDLDFADPHQSVWNAITVAIAVCLARDELRIRIDDFDPGAVVEESDPDV